MRWTLALHLPHIDLRNDVDRAFGALREGRGEEVNKISIMVLTVTFILGLSSAWAVDGQPMKFRDARNGGNCNACVWLAAEGQIVDCR